MLIDFEGIDGSGKGTQAGLLGQRLASHAHPHRLFSFPRYSDTLFGRAVGEFLNGRFGGLADVHPFLVSLLFAGDRYETRPLLLEAAAKQETILCDRYVPSNVAHQASKRTGAERCELMEKILQIEYEIYALPRPDLVLLLDLPVPVSQELIASKARRSYTEKAADIQEADAGYLQGVREVYLELARTEPGWRVIDCAPDGALRSKEELSEEIWQVVTETIFRDSSPATDSP